MNCLRVLRDRGSLRTVAGELVFLATLGALLWYWCLVG